MFELGRSPVVVLANLQIERLAQRLGIDHEGAGADDLGCIAKLLEGQGQGRQRDDTGTDHRRALEETRGRFLERELYRQRVDDFAALVIVDHFGNRLFQLLVAEAVGVEILGDGCGINRRSIGEGDAGPELERVFGGIVVDSPGFCQPGLDLQRLGVLVGQLVGDLVEDTAVRVKPASRRIEVGVSLLLEIDERAALDGRICGEAGRRKCGSSQQSEAERKKFPIARHRSGLAVDR
ncbi:hypothetical protein D3C80_1014530 [compost metagenome]